MHNLDVKAVKAVKANDKRALAVMAFDAACAHPESANWRAVAEILRLALPATKAKTAADPVAADSRFAGWSDYRIPDNATRKLGKSPVIVVTFADGEIIRAGAVTLPGKPVNIGRGVRIALAYYQGRMARRAGTSICDAEFTGALSIPAIVSCVCETTGEEFDPAQCTATMAEAGATVADASGYAPLVSPQAEAKPAGKPALAIVSRLLASSSLGARLHRLPVAPSCAILMVA